MAGGELTQVDGLTAGAWIEPRLDGWGGKVKAQIPQIYDAYVRIFHPASDEKGNAVTWGEVASALGSTAHREMQWHAIVGSYDSSNFEGSRWSGGNPNISELDEGYSRRFARFLNATRVAPGDATSVSAPSTAELRRNSPGRLCFVCPIAIS